MAHVFLVKWRCTIAGAGRVLARRSFLRSVSSSGISNVGLYFPHNGPRDASNYTKVADDLLTRFKISNARFADMVTNYKHYRLVNTSDGPKAGSFVEYTVNGTLKPAIVLHDRHFYLTSSWMYYVLTPSGTVDRISPNQITFHISDFVDPDYIPFGESDLSEDLCRQKLLDYTSDDERTSVAQLTYILNVMLGFTAKLTYEILSRSLQKAAYMLTAQTQKQNSVKLSEYIDIFMKSRGFSQFVSPTNSLALPSLYYATHSLFMNDPIHCRFIRSHSSLRDDSIQSYLHPLEQGSSRYFLNAINLSRSLLSVYNSDPNVIFHDYKPIFSQTKKYQIFILLSEDARFRSFIDFIKYTIEYPHPKLLAKLKQISPQFCDANGEVTPESLYSTLVSLDIYTEESNPALSSGIYGQFKTTMASSMVCRSLGQLKPYSKLRLLTLHDKSENQQIVVNQTNITSVNPKKEALVEDTESDMADTLNPGQAKSTQIFRICKNIAFSLKKMSMTKYIFNFFIPIPSRKIASWMISNPINFSQICQSGKHPIDPSYIEMPDQLPVDDWFKNYNKKGWTCFRVSFPFDYLNAESLTDPDINVSIDRFKHTKLLDDSFDPNLRDKPSDMYPSSSNRTGRRMLARMVTQGKLCNLLKQKEHARWEEGMLKVDIDPQDDVEDSDEYGDEFPPDKIVKEVRLLLDEFLSLYCQQKSIPVIHRSIPEDPTESQDSRKSRRFKIFKWYANSYETFRHSGRMDLTNYISCLQYLRPVEVGEKVVNGVKPLGVTTYASFTSSDFMESYINRIQLLDFLTGTKFLELELLQSKLESNSNAFLQLKSRLKRYITLKQLKETLKDDPMVVLRCIIIDPPGLQIIGGVEGVQNAIAYCPELDIPVEIETDQSDLDRNVMVGDRLMCTEVCTLNPVSGIIKVK